MMPETRRKTSGMSREVQLWLVFGGLFLLGVGSIVLAGVVGTHYNKAGYAILFVTFVILGLMRYVGSELMGIARARGDHKWNSLPQNVRWRRLAVIGGIVLILGVLSLIGQAHK